MRCATKLQKQTQKIGKLLWSDITRQDKINKTTWKCFIVFILIIKQAKNKQNHSRNKLVKLQAGFSDRIWTLWSQLKQKKQSNCIKMFVVQAIYWVQQKLQWVQAHWLMLNRFLIMSPSGWTPCYIRNALSPSAWAHCLTKTKCWPNVLHRSYSLQVHRFGLIVPLGAAQ